MDSIFTLIRQAAGMVTKLFSAGEKFASAAEHIGTWTDESAAAFSDEARYKRAANLKLMRKEFDINLEVKDNQLETIKTKKLVAPKV